MRTLKTGMAYGRVGGVAYTQNSKPINGFAGTTTYFAPGLVGVTLAVTWLECAPWQAAVLYAGTESQVVTAEQAAGILSSWQALAGATSPKGGVA